MSARTLEQFIDRFKFKHFSGKEITDYSKRIKKGVKNKIPPESLWNNIIKTLVVAEWLREKLECSLTITSAYRSPAYNATVGGEPGSYHMKFMALDLIPGNGVTPKQLASAAKKLRGVFELKIPGTNDSFIWKGGIGEYPNFVHIDCRGYDANW